MGFWAEVTVRLHILKHDLQRGNDWANEASLQIDHGTPSLSSDRGAPVVSA
jgi:hypothetical protein